MINIGENEKIFLIKRRHNFVLFAEIFPFTLVFILGIIGIISLYLYYDAELINNYLSNIPLIEDLRIDYYYFFLFIISLFLLIIWQFIFIIFAHFYLDCWIITDERTIHTELRSLFSRFYSSVSHNRIQDVTVDIHGIFSTIFKYGDLKIQTAGAFKDFVFRQIPEPYKTKDVLFEASKNKTNEDQDISI